MTYSYLITKNMIYLNKKVTIISIITSVEKNMIAI